MKICFWFCMLIMIHISHQQIDDSSIIDIIKNQIRPIIKNALETYGNFSDNCRNFINKSFLIGNNKTDFFYEKLIQDSSKSKNDLSTYYNCKKRKYNFNNHNLSDITYIELIIDETDIVDSLESETLFYILGICAPKGCKNREYSYFLDIIFSDFFRSNDTNQTEQILQSNQTNQTDQANQTKLKYSYIFLDDINDGSSTGIANIVINLIPFFLLFIQVILIFFNCVPFTIFKICFKKKKQQHLLNNEKDSSDDNNASYYKTEYKQFVTNMSLNKHWEKLFSLKDSGITYIKGLRGINIIFLFFGYLLFSLYNNPISIYEEHSFFLILQNVFYFVFYIGLRYSPAILVSCSAYSLFYKFSCFLDENVRDVGIRRQENIEKRKKRKKQKRDLIPIQNALDNLDSKPASDEEDEEEDEEDKKQNNIISDKEEINQAMVKYSSRDKDVQVKFLFHFLLNHIHKYLIYVFVVMFIRFSLHSLVLWINNFEVGPIWGYCWERIIKLSAKDLIKGILLIHSISRFNVNEKNEEIFINYLNMVAEEFISFLFLSVGLFCVHRFKYRFDIGIVGIFISVITIKILLFLVGHFLPDKEGAIKTIEYVTFYYHLDGAIKIRNPLLNFTYPMIGFLFGGVNYLFQKNLVQWERINNSKKEWLTIPFTIFSFFKKKTKVKILLIGVGFLFIILVFSAFQSVLLIFYPKNKNDEHLKGLYTHLLLNLFMHVDVEIVVILMHLISFGFFYAGDNIFKNLLTSSMWNIFENLYFSIILVINPVMIYVLAQCESRINLTMYNLIIYSLICGFLVIIVAGFVYIFIESPMQKISKLITNSFLRERQQEEQRDPSFDPLVKVD